MSWYRAPLWDLRPDIISCQNVAVWNLQSCIYWAPSTTRGRVCNLECNHSIVRVTQNPKPYYTVPFETLPTWRARFPYLYPPGTECPSYTPGHWVPFKIVCDEFIPAWARWGPSSTEASSQPQLLRTETKQCVQEETFTQASIMSWRIINVS
jgi:hypothetical protein